MSEINIKVFNDFLRTLGEKEPSIQVGVLADKNARSGGNSNASIGLKHEFGQDGMPIRSFLRLPLSEMLVKNLETAGAFNEDTLKKMIQEKSMDLWAEKIGIEAVATILEAFDTGGFGKWQPSNMNFKKNHQTLVETGQLRNAITYRVK